MKQWYLVSGVASAGVVSAIAFAIWSVRQVEPVPPSLAAAIRWVPETVTSPELSEAPIVDLSVSQVQTRPELTPPPPLPVAASVEESLPVIEPPLLSWSRDFAPGETLDGVLADAELGATDRAEVALALGAEYDLRRLRPGHGLTVVTTRPESRLHSVLLELDGGVRIEAVFGTEVETRVLVPQPELVIRAGEARIESSVFAALDEAGMPARFAVDLAQMLGGTFDFRRDLRGGETLRLMWQEARVGNEIIGQPSLTFVALDLGDTVFEIVWPGDESGRATIYRDGEIIRVFAQPVAGARLSSVFGRRTHPIYGSTRMHTGVDFAAPHGTPVFATAPGQVSFIGLRGGYGRVVEIAHGSETMTRYAHLSAVPEGLAVGQSVAAGDTIGRVGESGTATGPNLHYEVRVDGRPTDPLSDERLITGVESEALDAAALSRLNEARAMLDEQLAGMGFSSDIERI
ncbi:M23 family metallopeptidase [Nioella ostreopsis]|jgi:hypothetical protein|uniref:M23 family metallopeptidase n=1 Tax=Nioella ostreopsis TaxID=2448479 RepID=UPI000FD78542|nr:M23 family metallopeptidase [Nioella ostreopsis]